MRAKVLKSGKSPATRSNRKKADVEGEAEYVRWGFDAWSVRVTEIVARDTELEKQLEQSAS